MASAYATFADGGVYHKPHMITKVETADGRVLYDGATDPGEQRFSPQLARNVTESMLDVASSSLIPLAGGRPVAAKTGTTQSHIEGQNNDAWTIGYTPSISTAVWVGTDDNSPIKNSAGRPIYGRMIAGNIWQQFMNAALRGKPVEQFAPFEPIGTPPQAAQGGPAEDPFGQQDGAQRHRRHRGDWFNDQNGDFGLPFDLGGNGERTDRGNRGDGGDRQDGGDTGFGDDN
jgi:membrane peptidoglycan carboxypeptidase